LAAATAEGTAVANFPLNVGGEKNGATELVLSAQRKAVARQFSVKEGDGWRRRKNNSADNV
jgi:hypothetical protein